MFLSLFAAAGMNGLAHCKFLFFALVPHHYGAKITDYSGINFAAGPLSFSSGGFQLGDFCFYILSFLCCHGTSSFYIFSLKKTDLIILANYRGPRGPN